MPRCVHAPGLALVLLTVALFAGVPSAAAVVRYASPTGEFDFSDCTSPDPMADISIRPCTLERAVETVAVDSDEVIVAPGDYSLFIDDLPVDITKAISVHGADGQARPRIIAAGIVPGVVVNNPGASLRRVAIDYTGGPVALDQVSGLVEQVVARSSGDMACRLRNDVTLRDSVCWDDGFLGIGARVESVAGVHTANLRNVTAVATGSNSFGLDVRAVTTGVQQNLVAKNVIADGVIFDVSALAAASGTVATASLSTSNYSSEFEQEESSATASVTDPGTGVGNQTAPPLFTDAGLGLFHQAPGSPTIDAGAAADLLGSADIDAEPRTMGTAPDIGADEFVPTSTTPPSNAFTVGAITRNKKKGTATITVDVPNPGELTASGNGVQAASADRAVISKSVGAGQAQLLIKAKGKKKRKLNETGKVKLNVKITYTPTGGDPRTQSIKVKLKKKL